MKKINRLVKWISSVAFIFVILFVITGTDEMTKLSNIFEKLATLNISISIGYGALLAAIAALASNNSSQDKDTKSQLTTFVYITILYVILNIIIFLISFMIDDTYLAFLGRMLIGVLLFILIAYSNFLLKISVRLIY